MLMAPITDNDTNKIYASIKFHFLLIKIKPNNAIMKVAVIPQTNNFNLEKSSIFNIVLNTTPPNTSLETSSKYFPISFLINYFPNYTMQSPAHKSMYVVQIYVLIKFMCGTNIRNVFYYYAN